MKGLEKLAGEAASGPAARTSTEVCSTEASFKVGNWEQDFLKKRLRYTGAAKVCFSVRFCLLGTLTASSPHMTCPAHRAA